MNKTAVFQQINTKWYPQGFNCTPFLLIPPGSSGFDLKPVLHDCFQHFIFEFKEEYGKMHYPVDDLERLAKIILKKIKTDTAFLQETKKKSDHIYAAALQDVQSTPQENWSTLPESEFTNLIQKVMYLIRSCGIYGHIIEPFSLTTDALIKNRLSKYIKNSSELNHNLSVLTSPSEKSFLYEREEDLFRISKMSNPQERKENIQQHLRQFHWARNSYAGRTKLSEEEIAAEIKTIRHTPHDPATIKKQKEQIISTLGLDEELIILLEAVDFVTNWQDKRKKDIFIAIEIAEQLLEILAKRINVDHVLLRYLSYSDINASLFSNPSLRKVLEERRNGVVFYVTATEEVILTNQDYQEFQQRINQVAEQTQVIKEFNGMTASLGTAVGPVKVCRSIQDINNVQEGDILVASMTRPEFLPAMKKAAAFITDEGGLTCHAAIVARELHKPCIIGTKIATQILHDGDLVEVKANHGLVQVLEKQD